MAEQLIWFRRFAEGVSPKLALDAEVETDRARLRERLLDGAAAWLPLIDGLAEPSASSGRLEYTTHQGRGASLPFAATLAHVFNHGTHHRGQITAAITAMGQRLPGARPGVDAAGREPTRHDATLDIRRPSAHVAEVWLNRPDVRNAFNDAVIAELTRGLRASSAPTPTLRAIVLGGHGKAFCAGADLSWMRAMADYTWEQNRADAQALADMLWTIYSCPVPVVGRIHGDCYAGGVGLAAVCDVLVAADVACTSA